MIAAIMKSTMSHQVVKRTMFFSQPQVRRCEMVVVVSLDKEVAIERAHRRGQKVNSGLSQIDFELTFRLENLKEKAWEYILAS